jgi:tol-pal system protein YbgF
MRQLMAHSTQLTVRGLVRWALVGAMLVTPLVQAGIFDDGEARRAILDLRQRIDQSSDQQRARQAELAEQISQLKRSMLELNNQLEQTRTESAKLQGQNEQLTRDVAEMQRKQKDLQAGMDDRIRKFEPQKVSFEGKDFNVEPEEKRQYDDAMELLRKNDYPGTVAALSTFRKRYPSSGYMDSVLFWLGNAHYGSRQYKDAVVTFRTLVSAAPDHPKSPEAMLAIANCQAELKDNKSARRTLDELLKTYPKSEAAQAAKERLASLK